MGKQEKKKVEFEETKEDSTKLHQESPSTDVHEDDKSLAPAPHHKAIAATPTTEKCSEVSCDRDTVLARVEEEKKLALIKAWEDNEKAKADNKAYKKFSAITSWENCKKAIIEAKLRKREEKLEKVKAKYAEKLKNKMAEIHKLAEEKRATVEARRGEEVFKTEEKANKYKATGTTPSKFLGCFSS